MVQPSEQTKTDFENGKTFTTLFTIEKTPKSSLIAKRFFKSRYLKKIRSARLFWVVNLSTSHSHLKRKQRRAHHLQPFIIRLSVINRALPCTFCLWFDLQTVLAPTKNLYKHSKIASLRITNEWESKHPVLSSRVLSAATNHTALAMKQKMTTWASPHLSASPPPCLKVIAKKVDKSHNRKKSYRAGSHCRAL